MQECAVLLTLDALPEDVVWYEIAPFMASIGGLCLVSDGHLRKGWQIFPTTQVARQVVKCAVQNNSIADLYVLYGKDACYRVYWGKLAKWAAGAGSVSAYDWFNKAGCGKLKVGESAAKHGRLSMLVHLLMDPLLRMGIERWLWTAAKEGHLAVVEFLLTHGATEVNVSMRNAAVNGHLDVVEVLLAHGATDVDVAMWQAAGNGHLAVVEILQNRRAPE